MVTTEDLVRVGVRGDDTVTAREEDLDILTSRTLHRLPANGNGKAGTDHLEPHGAVVGRSPREAEHGAAEEDVVTASGVVPHEIDSLALDRGEVEHVLAIRSLRTGEQVIESEVLVCIGGLGLVVDKPSLIVAEYTADADADVEYLHGFLGTRGLAPGGIGCVSEPFERLGDRQCSPTA